MKKEVKQIKTKYSWKTKASSLTTTSDFEGKTILITGATNGVGLSTTKALLKTQAKIYVLVRNIELAKKRFGKHPNVIIKKLDLSNFDSIISLIRNLKEENVRIDFLINNAGVMGGKKTIDENGLEKHIKTNYFAPFILTNGLLDNINDGGKIINLSSVAHKWSRVHLEDINFNNRKYQAKLAYAQSKTANILFSVSLADKLRSRNIGVYAVHPGIIPLSSIWTPKNKVLKATIKGLIGFLKFIQITSILNLVYFPFRSRIVGHFKTNNQGAATTIWCMKESELDNYSGEYLEDCNIYGKIDEKAKKSYGVAKYAVDKAKAKELWNYTIKQLKKYDFYNEIFED